MAVLSVPRSDGNKLFDVWKKSGPVGAPRNVGSVSAPDVITADTKAMRLYGRGAWVVERKEVA